MSVKHPYDNKVKRGDTSLFNGGLVKVMAVADGYVMCRRPGCMPFVMGSKEFYELENKKVQK